MLNISYTTLSTVITLEWMILKKYSRTIKKCALYVADIENKAINDTC